jgi:type IV secretion system protein VirB2
MATPVWPRFARKARSARHNTWFGIMAKIMAVIIIIVTGLTLAFGDTSGGFRRLVQIVFGLSIAFAASSFFLSFFSFGGGALV